jgi:hypothetical protein
MKFDLPEAEVKLIDGKLVQLPAKRFIGLMEYVEDLEARLLSAEVHLREAERVGTEMERFAAARKSQEQLSPEALKNVQKIVDEFTSPEKLKAAGQQRGISMRRLSMITAIPYATLYRYMTRKKPLDVEAAAKIQNAIYGGELAVKNYSVKMKDSYQRG